MAVYKLYAKNVRGQKDLVYLYLYNLPSGKKVPKLTSLKIKVPRKDCVFSKSGEFKRISKELPEKYYFKNFKSVEHINKFLEEQLQKFILASGAKDFIPNDEKTINDWFVKIIERQKNVGTKMRYQNVLKLLEDFHLFYSKDMLKMNPTKQILFRKLDVDLINGFHNWLQSEPKEGEQREKNIENSANYKVKALKSIINKAHKEGYFHFYKNPFDYISFKFRDSKVEILTLDELKKIINTNYVEVLRRSTDGKWGNQIEGGVVERNKKNKRYKAKHTLEDIRNYFLFQLFSQGIRVSDLITLRYNDFYLKDGVLRIGKIMVKTKHHITIKVNDKMTDILSKYIGEYDIVKEDFGLLEKLNTDINKIIFKTNDGFKIQVGIGHENYKFFESTLDKNHITLLSNALPGYLIGKDELEQAIKIKISKSKLNIKDEQGRKIQIPNINGLELNNKMFSWFDNEKSNLKKHFKRKLISLKSQKHELVCNMLNKISTSIHSKDFIFSLLNNKDFTNISNNDFSYLSDFQYRKFQSARTYYNKLLKLIGNQAGIEKRLSSHIARHSYTSLMLDLGENINLFDAMTSLGHKHIATTQTYLQRFDHKKIDKLNEIISDKLNDDENSILNV